MRRWRFYILILGLTLLPQLLAASDLVGWLADQGQLALGLSLPGFLILLNLPLLAEMLRRKQKARLPRILVSLFQTPWTVWWLGSLFYVLLRAAWTVAHLGPDILVDPFDLEEVIRRARRSDAPTLGELLLEQQVCAGIGNIYKCESLWGLRLDPWTRPAELDDERLRQLYLMARDLMRRNLVTPIARQRHAVHARGGRPCPRCGTPIRIRAQGQQARLTYYCPRCQREPARTAPA